MMLRPKTTLAMIVALAFLLSNDLLTSCLFGGDFNYLHNAEFHGVSRKLNGKARERLQLRIKLNPNHTVTVLNSSTGHGSPTIGSNAEYVEESKWKAVDDETIEVVISANWTDSVPRASTIDKFIITVPTSAPVNPTFVVEGLFEKSFQFGTDDRDVYKGSCRLGVILSNDNLPRSTAPPAGNPGRLRAGQAADSNTSVNRQLYFFGLAVNSFDDKFFPSLSWCQADVFALGNHCKIMAKRNGMRYVPILCDGDDTTREKMLASLDEVQVLAGPEDTVVMAFATHGVNLQRGLYLALPQSKSATMQGTSIEWALISKCVTQLKAGRVVVLLDACHAGSFAESNLEILKQVKRELSTRSGLTVISASDAHTQAQELSDDYGHGAFTQALLDVLPSTNFPWDSADNYFPKIKTRVSELTDGEQIPVLSVDVDRTPGADRADAY